MPTLCLRLFWHSLCLRDIYYALFAYACMSALVSIPLAFPTLIGLYLFWHSLCFRVVYYAYLPSRTCLRLVLYACLHTLRLSLSRAFWPTPFARLIVCAYFAYALPKHSPRLLAYAFRTLIFVFPAVGLYWTLWWLPWALSWTR